MVGKERINILLVDNQASQLGEPLSEMLNFAPGEDKYNVIATDDPRKALDLSGNIDLAIIGLDLTIEYSPELYADFLPEIKENVGYKLLIHLKKQYPAIKVVILASYAACEAEPINEKAVALEKGADGFVSKPFSSGEMIGEIERALGH